MSVLTCVVRMKKTPYTVFLSSLIVFYCNLQSTTGKKTCRENGIPINVSEGYQDTELVHVQMVLRHGDRNPDPTDLSLFPRSPYANSTFYPSGPSGLTNRGKYRNFLLGEFLRSRYGADNFLDSVYLTEELSVYADESPPRTRMTALGVLSGLYPPEPIQQCDPCLCWQPIPYDMLPALEDATVYYYNFCPRVWTALDEAVTTPYLRARLAPYDYLYEVVRKEGGGNVTTINQMASFMYGIKGLESENLPLPAWIADIRDDLEALYELYYEARVYDRDSIKIAAGPQLIAFLANCHAAINGTKPGPVKLRLLSLHATNLSVMMAATHAVYPRAYYPDYCSAFAIELRRRRSSGQYGVTLMLLCKAGTDLPPLYLEIADCGVFCPFDRFVEIVSEHLATFDEIKQMCA